MKVATRGHATDSLRERVGFVVNQDDAVLGGQLAKPFEVARLWQDDADVGHGWLNKCCGNVSGSECSLSSIQVVERNHDGGLGWVNLRADVVLTRDGVAVVVKVCKSLVNRAVVAVIVHQNLRATGHVTGVAQNVAVGVCCGERELPLRHPETLGEGGGGNCCVIGWQHECNALG